MKKTQRQFRLEDDLYEFLKVFGEEQDSGVPITPTSSLRMAIVAFRRQQQEAADGEITDGPIDQNSFGNWEPTAMFRVVARLAGVPAADMDACRDYFIDDYSHQDLPSVMSAWEEHCQKFVERRRADAAAA